MILDNVTKLYQFRWLVYELVLRNVSLRYRGSLLGFLWTFLNPILFVGIYTLVFSVYLKAGIHNFALFVLAGMVPYTCFSASVLQGTTSILDGRAYVGKTLFPTIALTNRSPLCSGDLRPAVAAHAGRDHVVCYD